MEIEFKLEGEYIELIKLLKVSGLCQTGGQAKVVTTEGEVQVDGKIETRKKNKIRRGQIVEFGGSKISVV
jgi:ribosome-associated protein